MVGRVHRDGSLFYAAFGNEAALIKDDLLDPIDALLADPELVALVAKALGKRRPRSHKTGRRGIAPDRALRALVLKHIKGWSFRQLVRELRASLVYRRFTRFDHDRIPSFQAFSNTFACIGEELTRDIHARVVGQAREARVAPGNKLRTDTTVVESNVHYPTDSTLLQDGVRVLTRAAQRISEQCAAGSIHFVNRARATKHRVLEIHRAAKSFTEASRTRLQDSYWKLVGIASGVLRKARKVAVDVRAGRLPLLDGASSVQLMRGVAEVNHFGPLVDKVIAQTKARVFGGDTHVVGKVLSLFEEHTQAIRKGKAHKPTEFGRLVRIDEVENGIVSHYDVKDGNPADANDFVPAVSQHKQTFGRAPKRATADRGFFSAKNEREARKLGVERVALPARGKLSRARSALQKQRWFKRAMRWHAGIEARIGTLKHRFGMVRAFYKGDRGFKRYVGWSIIANNLVSIARVRARRKTRQDAQTKRAA
jgi:IS5 family transposase